MEDQFAKQLASQSQELTGIDKVRNLIDFEYFDEAIALCNTVLISKKTDRDHLTQKFRAYVLSDRSAHESIPSIIADLEKAHPLCLKDQEYIETKFNYYLAVDRLQKAEDLLPTIKAIFGERNSKYSGCIAMVLLKQNRRNEALNLINHGLHLNEYDGDLYELKGDIYLKHIGDSESALTQYKYSTQMNKRNPMLYQKMATILFDKHFYGDAVQNASVALEQINSASDKKHLTEQQRQCILLRGKSLLYLKDFEEAQTNFQRILDFDEKCVESRMGKAAACMFRGKSDQAVAIFKKGEELNSKYVNYSSWMALAYFLRKDYDNCEIFLKKYYKKLKETTEQTQTSQQSEIQRKEQQIFDVLNYVNFLYLDENYAKASFDKCYAAIDFINLPVHEIERMILTSLGKFEAIKKNLLEYLQQLMLYLIGGIYTWYPEDLYPYLLKQSEVGSVHAALASVYSIIERNQKSGIYKPPSSRQIALR